jgi:DNA-binding NarL/FixJ family response regulator
VNGLVRRLVKQIANEPPAGAAAGDQVILDMQVDGVRCVLVRMPPEPARPSVILSPREGEIARMVACGYPNKTIAGVLEISTWTVGTYLRRVFAKLNVGSRAAMVARLMQEGLLKRVT